MKKAFKSIVAFSFVLNIVWFSLWIYVFNKFEAQVERVENFNRFFANIPLEILGPVFILLTISSLIILHWYYLNLEDIKSRSTIALSSTFIILIFQYFFLGLIFWGYL